MTSKVGFIFGFVIILLYLKKIRCDYECDVKYPDFINCDTDEYFDIKQELLRISDTLNNTKDFEVFTLFNSPIGELPDNTFADITFDEISIHQTTNLSKIHANAFRGPTASVTRFLLFTGTDKLRNDPPDFDIYSAFTSLVNLRSITLWLESFTSHEIPENAFSNASNPVNSLEEITFNGYFNISKINDYAFYELTNLNKWITFSSIPINYISSHSFDFRLPSDTSLSIFLQNCSLTENSFGEGVFNGSQRPLSIYLKNNQIRYIPEDIFGPFFNSSYSGSYIDIEDNPLDCDDINQFQWLLDRHSQLRSRLRNGKCNNGTLLWDLVNYECEVEFPNSILCDTNRIDFDIKQELERISLQQTEDQKHFTEFRLSNALIDMLPESTFSDITFYKISIINTQNLTSIHKNAFSGPTANVTQYLFLTQTNKLSNSPPDNDLFVAFSSLVNSESMTICLESNTYHEIPEYAFSQNNGPLNFLESISFKGEFGISKINNYSFIGLSDLNCWLTFSFIPIEYIASRAFDLSSASNHTLDIHLQNCSLTESSFESGVFSGSQRPLNIDLRENQIRFIDESVFRPFFDSNSSGYINMEDNPLECDDIERFEWLFERQTELENRITNAVCKNGTLLWELSTKPTSSPPINSKCIVEYPNYVICNIDGYFDIKQEFLLISEAQPQNEKHFTEFLLYYSSISELPENTFADITFDEIDIRGIQNLSSIHTNSFNGPTANITKSVILSGTNKLKNNPPDYDLFAAISSLTNLKSVYIRLESYTSHEIPENAFRPQNNLEEINFRGDFNISKINNYVFYELTNLHKWIYIAYLPIGYISARAFDFRYSSANTLQIYLQNSLLTESSFESGVFSGSQRPLNIDLSGNQIRFIEESTFSSFFNSNSSGYINMESNPLECDDIERFEWLLERQSELEKRLTNAVCKNGTLLWELSIKPTSRPPINSKCTVEYPNYVICNIDGYFDIKQEFLLISEAQPQNEKHFTEFLLNSSSISELPENTFADITFNEIYISGTQNLTSIHTNSFSGPTAKVTKNIILSGANKLRNNPPDYDLFAAISSLTNLKSVYIRLESYTSHEIPENAFRPQNNLEEINFRGDFNISKINNYAFYELTTLKKWIHFSFLPIGYISARAFDFRYTSVNTLQIYLQNCSLTESSFESGVFSGSQRPLNIDLRGNQIRYIDESVFRSFFDSNSSGYINMESNPLECDDIERFEWLFERQSELEKRITNAFCKNGTLLWELSTKPTPRPPINSKCTVEYPNYVICNIDGYFDIKQEFLLISEAQPQNEKHFKDFHLWYSSINELPQNTFADITFDEIEIYRTENLTSMHTNSFSGPTAKVTKNIILSGANKLRNNPPDYDLFAAISSLTNLKSIDIRLESYTSHEIPEKAFRPQNNLEVINFRGDFNISKINNYVFYELTTLKKWIHFSFLPIGYISARAFDFRYSSVNTLQIYLQNCSLTESSFESGVFSGSQRPLNIDLRGNQIHYIDESVFSPFFDSNSSGYIDMKSNPLECNDIERFEWLFERETQLKERIKNAYCKNGTSIWNLNTIETKSTLPPN